MEKKNENNNTDWDKEIEVFHKKWEDMWISLEKRGITRTPLWKEAKDVPGWKKDVEQPIPSLAIWPIQEKKRGIVIVCAGGGFMFKSAGEAEPVAEAFHKAGMNAAILDYRYRPYDIEEIQEDAKRSIRYFKTYGNQMGIDANHVAIGGFSAGGMVTALAITRFDSGFPHASDPIERASSRPDAAFQMYGSFRKILRTSSKVEERTPALLRYSYTEQNKEAKDDIILQLPLDAPPLFMAQTDSDDPRNVLQMGMAYADRGIPFEAHTFSGGPHGGGLFDGEGDTPDFPHTSHWFTLATEWFALQGF